MSYKPTSHFYALLSGAAFLAALSVLALLIWDAETLVSA